MKFDELYSAAKLYKRLTGYYNNAYFDLFKREDLLNRLRQDPSVISPKEIDDEIIGFLKSWKSVRHPISVEDLQKRLAELMPYFNLLKGQKIEEYDFKQESLVITIYNGLQTRGIGPTNASKILHIMNPELFVMWDSAISNHYWQEYKSSGARGHWYLYFLKEMQKEAKEVIQDFQAQGHKGNPADFISQKLDYHPPKTLAKFIDEYNYIKYTKRFSIPPKEHLLDFLRFC